MNLGHINTIYRENENGADRTAVAMAETCMMSFHTSTLS